ncbi:MAG: RNA-guided pseudouridylation complex pseudouridine synthase subunit Cbf5 [Candidatus Aenigmarchaeota archaeon]|nr:RNA-guided pseudouridylation complex pseudouridine synthase subunit Cbf5 [Candidatus Aenigmarchaeota archaeon]NIP41040.1 RNA-guided pseudouridylation complex pseudouridine synthase subunit Cbf5 [Candidatus Aenigmarchaeota archaeon]NIQ17442.1 RNA-guided pseudouridylation complex pseudouridine synthase subunit Cbf5 [Candidatus Aenigmarchaeota archaeon]NIS73636.1 RNA-guided pseudouridylation complex pseudouridine synthase subunit Cbf5 [Candidatus Aenigmarchaeota archaeon]
MKTKIRKGVVLVDKPKGITSFDVVERVGQKLGIEKAGHTGTLDPNVTGLMLIALEESRKAMPVLMGMDKEYVGKMWLHGEAERKTIEKTFRKFTGEIVQKPPVRSRVARVERKRKVRSLKILKVRGREIEFKVSCEAGTYIRKLVHDIGEEMGCGAHMTELRRTKIGPFFLKESVPLSKLSVKNAIPLERILERIRLKKIIVKDQAIPKIRNGSPVFKEWIMKRGKTREMEIVGIFDRDGEIIALGKPSEGKIKTDRVFSP